MSKVNRREFLEEVIAIDAKEGEIKDDLIYKKYANKALPKTTKATTGLTAYAGQWTRNEVIHLLRRTTFGIKEADIQTLLAMTPGAAVDYLFSNIPASPPTPPLNNYNTGTYTDPTGVLLGQTWVNAAYGDGTVNSKRRSSFKSWWFGLTINHNLSILEKMVFFWHNHFVTETNAIGDARFAYVNNALLRANAVGNFKTITKLITKDPAMLAYLNGYLNTKNAPDENYARELQELFTLGKTNVPNYLEIDVQTAAKVLTGWRIDVNTVTSYFDPTKHETSNKQFSSFYNNTVINYQSGANGANETDQLIDMIFAKVECAKFICRKLYRFFIYYVIDSSTETNIIVPLANTLINNNFEIAPVLKQLLKSEHFFDTVNQGCFIKTPLDFLCGIFRTFGITLPASFTVDKTYAVWNYLRGYGNILALDLGDPPNVSGYPAYYQSPEYYEAWINSNTYPKRLAFGDMMLGSGFNAGTGTSIKIDILGFTQSFPNAGDPDLLVDYFVEMLMGITVSATKKAAYKSILLSGQSTNYYWTQAWTDYLTNPTTANINTVKTRLTTLVTEILRMAEHQLC
jgi:uncharacterized protein (DUF1800 family)